MLDKLIGVDWTQMLGPDTAMLEMFLRGTVTYLGLFAVLRVSRRATGRLNVADVLLITVLADAAQNAMGGEYRSISSGFMLIATIVFWDRVLDHLAYHYRWAARIVEAAPSALIRDGQIQRASLRRHKISEEELAAHLREHEIDDAREVRLCLLEGDGRISVLKHRPSGRRVSPPNQETFGSREG